MGDRLGISYVAGGKRGRSPVEIQETRRKTDEAPSMKKDKKEIRNLYKFQFNSPQNTG